MAPSNDLQWTDEEESTLASRIATLRLDQIAALCHAFGVKFNKEDLQGVAGEIKKEGVRSINFSPLISEASSKEDLLWWIDFFERGNKNFERPANLSEKSWVFLMGKISEAPGRFLMAAGIIEHPELLAGIILNILLENTEIECFIPRESATTLSSGASHILLKRLGDKKEYLVPRGVVLNALEGEIDYLEKI